MLFNEKVLACVRQKNNISPSSTTDALSSASDGPTIVTMTNSVVTSFDEETTTTTTTTPVAVTKPLARGPLHRERLNGHMNSPLNNGRHTISSTTTSTSGGVTIVNLNVVPSVIQSNQVSSSSALGATSPPHTG